MPSCCYDSARDVYQACKCGVRGSLVGSQRLQGRTVLRVRVEEPAVLCRLHAAECAVEAEMLERRRAGEEAYVRGPFLGSVLSNTLSTNASNLARLVHTSSEDFLLRTREEKLLRLRLVNTALAIA